MGHYRRDLIANRVTWSDELPGIYGLTPQEGPIDMAMGSEMIHPRGREHVFRAAQESVRSGMHSEAEHRVVRAHHLRRLSIPLCSVVVRRSLGSVGSRIKLQQTNGGRHENQGIRKGCYVACEALLLYIEFSQLELQQAHIHDIACNP